jgi:acyl-CoA thioesterase-1
MCVPAAAHAAPAIVVVGDSLSSAYGLAERRGWVALLGERLRAKRFDYSVVNASIAGDTTSDGRARFGALLARRRPAIVILELGGNDGLRGLPPAQMKRNLAAMIAQARKADARVLLVGVRMPPNYGEEYTRAFAAAFRDLAQQTRVAFVPELTAGVGERLEYFQDDRIHPNAAAQPLLLDNVWPALRPLLGRATRGGKR